MSFMLRRSHFLLVVLLAFLGLVLSSPCAGAQQGASKRGRKYKAPPPTAHIEVTVLRDVDGKPIENAAVVFHAKEDGKDTGNMELKTNEDGKAVIDVMPIGDIVTLQIIAKGFQTFGEDYKIDKPTLAIEIRLKRPGEQYSIYKDHSHDGDAGKTPAPAPNAPAPNKDKPAPPATAQPSPTQPQSN
jgi:hypothetical protein